MAEKKQVDALDITLVKSVFTNKQMEKLLAPTNKKHIKKKPGSGSYSYVTSYYVTSLLNHIFGYRWSYEILSESESKQGANTLISVRGRLTITTETGLQLSREQYGSSSNAKDPYKSAASDALKKCASLFGVAQDVYSQVEGKEYEIVDADEKETSVELESVISFMLSHVSAADRNDFMKTAAYLKYKDNVTVKQIVKVWNS
jgi:recombination DNA repair RAD52 pathway protein